LILNEKDQEIAQLAAAIALADKTKMQEVMAHYLKKYADAYQGIEHILMHQIVYCGFPVAMNGFAILQELTR
jgi:alkylhydroperoxidase/carboxymuconolactone decarboxylase family protein YurZ